MRCSKAIIDFVYLETQSQFIIVFNVIESCKFYVQIVGVWQKSVKIVNHQGNVQIVVVKNVVVGGVSILIDYYTRRIGIEAINLFSVRYITQTTFLYFALGVPTFVELLTGK